MSLEDKSDREAAQAHRTRKIRDDFLRWLKEKNASKKKAEQERIAQAARATSQALMVWTDDGGAAS